MLLRIVAGYRQRGRRVRLVKVGNAAEARFRVHTFKTIERLDIGDRVLIIDNVDDENLALTVQCGRCLCVAPRTSRASAAPRLRRWRVVPQWWWPRTERSRVPWATVALSSHPPAAPPAWMDALDSLFGEHATRDGFRQRGLERASEFDDARMARATYDVYATLSMLARDHGV